jgi:hypothetical protein
MPREIPLTCHIRIPQAEKAAAGQGRKRRTQQRREGQIQWGPSRPSSEMSRGGQQSIKCKRGGDWVARS